MARHPKDIINEIKRLRSEGKSIEEIMLLLSLAKTTVWHHVKGIPLSTEQKQALKSSKGGGHRRKINRIKMAQDYAKKLLSGPDRESVIMVAMLYWAEGHKNNGCQFTNTDDRMIALYVGILRRCLGVQNDQLRVEVRVFTGMNIYATIIHWMAVARLPASQVRVFYNDGGTNSRKQYGICRIRVIKSQYLLHCMAALVDNIVSSY